MPWRRAAETLLLAAAVSCGAAESVRAQTADDLFDPGVLHDVRLHVNSKDLALLREHYFDDTIYPADFHWNGRRVRNVGIRSRGWASRSPSKPGLEVVFDEYVTGQRFLDLRSLVLDNLWQDPTMIKEYVAMAFFARMGEPAPRVSLSRVYINNAYHGVYAIIEAIDAGFLGRTLGDTAGYLFEFRHAWDFHGEYLGEDALAYKPLFEARTHRDEADWMLYSPVRDLFRAVNDETAAWRDHVDAGLDLTQFLTFVAIETFLSEGDGLLGFYGMNNFYLFRPAGAERHRVLPWDRDQSFEQIRSPLFVRAGENEIFRRAMADEELLAVYRGVLEQCARSAMLDDWLPGEIARATALVADATRDDSLKPYTNDEFDAAAAFMAEFARQRSAFVLQSLSFYQ